MRLDDVTESRLMVRDCLMGGLLSFAIVIALAALACSVDGLRVVGCPPLRVDAYAPLVDAVDGERVDVLCVDDIGWPSPPDAWGVTDWPGDGSAFYPARVRVLRSLDDETRAWVLAHEAQHLQLWRSTGDPCDAHDELCGWVE